MSAHGIPSCPMCRRLFTAAEILFTTGDNTVVARIQRIERLALQVAQVIEPTSIGGEVALARALRSWITAQYIQQRLAAPPTTPVADRKPTALDRAAKKSAVVYLPGHPRHRIA